jgi:outer membrane autotransporter protein
VTLPVALLLAISLGFTVRASAQTASCYPDMEERVAELYATADVCKMSPALIAELEDVNAQVMALNDEAQCAPLEARLQALEKKGAVPRMSKRRKLTNPRGALPPCTSLSDKLKSLQQTGTQTMALAAGASYTSFIQGAIGEALSGGSVASSSPFVAPSGLGMGGPGSRRPPWRAWTRARVSGTTGDEPAPGANIDWQHVTVAAGTDYLVAPGMVVGAFTGFEDFRYTRSDILGRLKGDGPTVGAYLGALVLPKVRLEAGIGHSWLGYVATADTASGDFDGKRWLFTGSLTGTYALGPFTLEPSAQLFWLRENQEGYVDSLGNLHESLAMSIGRGSVGARMLYPMPLNGLTLAPYAGLYLDRYFGLEGGANVTVPDIGIADELWSMRLTGGLVLGGNGAWSIAVGGEAGNLGTGDGLIWSGQLTGSIKF